MENRVFPKIRRYLGIACYDLPFVLPQAIKPSNLAKGELPWLKLHNRGEMLSYSKNHMGAKCNWSGGSDLYLPKVMPACGRWLFRRALSDFPIRYGDKPGSGQHQKPQVSYIIGHRGLDRLPLLLETIQTIQAQEECSIECIVVEQDHHRKIETYMPSWIRYIHAPLDDDQTAFSRSRAFNAGAIEAKSELLIFHDGDILVPQGYAKEAHKRFKEGYDFINLKRFIFYLDRQSSAYILEKHAMPKKVEFDAIVQNLVGGASLAISRASYLKVGGFDERFVGWGYEDIEFMDRAATLKDYPYDYLPFVHLWHEAQKGKWSADAPGLAIYEDIKKNSVEKRISHLQRVNKFD